MLNHVCKTKASSTYHFKKQILREANVPAERLKIGKVTTHIYWYKAVLNVAQPSSATGIVTEETSSTFRYCSVQIICFRHKIQFYHQSYLQSVISKHFHYPCTSNLIWNTKNYSSNNCDVAENFLYLARSHDLHVENDFHLFFTFTGIIFRLGFCKLFSPLFTHAP